MKAIVRNAIDGYLNATSSESDIEFLTEIEPAGDLAFDYVASELREATSDRRIVRCLELLSKITRQFGFLRKKDLFAIAMALCTHPSETVRSDAVELLIRTVRLAAGVRDPERSFGGDSAKLMQIADAALTQAFRLGLDERVERLVESARAQYG